MKVGDLIALPLRQSGKVTNSIAVGRVVGSAEIDMSQDDDNARLHRAVDWVTRSVARPAGLPKGRPTVQKFKRDAVQVLTRTYLEMSFLSGDEAGVLPQGNLEYPEGAKTRVEVNRYERNRGAREACIREHGVACKVCGLVFEKRYGQLGHGYIHVHHTTPLSEINYLDNYVIDPITNLVPVCPNCHAMLHRDPGKTLTVEELRRIINEVPGRNDCTYEGR
ncbi:MAG: hypothetical protein F4003_04150 [Acidimicrobiaceae bacterium]|nr:hypothetical protein [Acidimicrobiaceae bacterium]MYC41943.1 hypothetical protein [Acidimicrobiaceae bacterium]